MKCFNTTAVCIPSKHYMVDISEKVSEIKKLVDSGKYFTINRARQYGKTTTLNALRNSLLNDYEVVSLDFQSMGYASFETEGRFCKGIIGLILEEQEYDQIKLPEKISEYFNEFVSRSDDKSKIEDLSKLFRLWCRESDKNIVFMVDEVDSATNNQVFLDFLASLRDAYINRDTKRMPAFQSVILVGVTDIKHLKAKIRDDAESKENSPWNIAADFTIDMSLSESGIREMLDEYDKDHNVGMETELIANQIRQYTNGYPFLVSRICQLIDERFVPGTFKTLSEAWTADGVNEAVKYIVSEKNTLFDSLMAKLRDYEKIRNQMESLLFRGETIEYLPDNKEQEQLIMYGFAVNDHSTVVISNKIFEMRLYKFFVGESRFAQDMRREALEYKQEFIKDGELNIPLIMEKFIDSQKIIRNMNDEMVEKKFIEEEGRERFLTYISPIINGVGTYSVEDQTANSKRMDLVIHYNGKRYIIELKIWHGERYNSEGGEQIMSYLDRFGLDTGYMLSFSFNKKKETGVRQVRIGDKLLYEGIV